MSTDATNQSLIGGLTCGSGLRSAAGNIGNHYQPSLPNITSELNFTPETGIFDACWESVVALNAQRGFRAVLQSANDNRCLSDFSALDIASLERLAIDPRTPQVLLQHLSRHPSADLRALLAENSSTPQETMWMLVNDGDADVRYQLAENPHVASDLLRSLADDENPYVSCRALKTLSRITAI